MRPNASVKLPEAETHGGVDCGNDCLTREVDGASHSWRNEGDRWDAPLGGDGAPGQRETRQACSSAANAPPARSRTSGPGAPALRHSSISSSFIRDQELPRFGEFLLLRRADYRVVQIQRRERVDHRGGHDHAREPFVVRRHNIPRRMAPRLSAGRACDRARAATSPS